MPAGWEASLRLVEAYLGRDNATVQPRGIFPSLAGAPTIAPNRVVRNRSSALTGVAAQTHETITAHGVRPTVQLPLDAKAEDLILPFLALFHNFEYTQITPPAGNIEVGTYKFAMLDGKPDRVGAVIGTYDTAAASYGEQALMSDAYTVACEWLYGRGDLGDTDNGTDVQNVIFNECVLSVDRGIDQWLSAQFNGFGRDASELASFPAVSWGPGINGAISAQGVLTPDQMTLNVLSVNSVDVIATYNDWLDGLTININAGLDGRDALGFDHTNAIATAGRPSVSGSIRMAHVGSDFFNALINSEKIELTFTFSAGVNQNLKVTIPYLKIIEGFAPNTGDVGADSTIEIPFQAVVDTTVVAPLIEVQVDTAFDIRTTSTNLSNTLALVP